MALSNPLPGRTRAIILAAMLALISLALYAPNALGSIFGHKKNPEPAKSDAAKPGDAPAAETRVPQLNPDGSPKLDADGNVITEAAPPPCVPAKHKKCPKKKKEKAPKVEPVTIARGVFTVDGVIGKAALNYDIPDLKFIYFYAPGLGVVVISDNKFPGAEEQKDAFNGHTLTVKLAGEHTMQLFSDEIMLSKRGSAGKVSKQNKKTEPAYIFYDPKFTLPVKFPMVGYGKKSTAPYEWPGSKVNGITKGIDADAPQVPTRLAPKLAANPCPTGMVLLNPPPAPQAGAPKVDPVAPAELSATAPRPKCVLPKDVPAAPPPQEKYIPLDQRPRS